MDRFMFILSFLVYFVPEPSVQQQCRTNSDVGEVECVLLSPYSHSQWSTCLTADYARRASNQRHCLGRATVCWYRCMLELHERDCRCSPGETVPTDNLPPHCYSPRGDDCSWYRECLERRYQCEGTSHGYAIEYAEKFCNLYSNHYNDFSPNGRNWVDGVRKCLQVALVPYLRPWVMKTCENIRKGGFNSHPSCYLTPGSGAPSICHLSIADLMSTVCVIFEGRQALSSVKTETFKQILSVATGCPSLYIQELFTNIYTTLRMHFGTRHSMPASESVDYIARTQDWSESGFRWFAWEDDDNLGMGNRNKRQTTDEYTNINVLLVDTKVLNISNGTISTPPGNIDLDQAVENLANAVGDGLLSKIPIVLNGTEMHMEMLSVGQCTDILCNSTNVTELATAPPPSPTSGANTALIVQLHFMTVICVIQYFLLIM